MPRLSGRGPGRSLTAKGQTTRTEILEVAHEVFKEFGYYGTSVSEIARRCRISTAAFYQYFCNKDQVFLELNDLNISRFMERTGALGEDSLDVRDRLRKALRLLYRHTRENSAFHRILGESELVDRVTVAYYESIARFYRDFFRREAMEGRIRPLDPNMLAYGMIGICYLHSLDWGSRGDAGSEEELTERITDLLMHGISGPAPWVRPEGWDPLSLPEPVFPEHAEDPEFLGGKKTRRKIGLAAERVFSRHGFNHSGVGEITREAGVALGTFYIHYASKDELIAEFVRYLSRKIRRELQRFAVASVDRRDAERVGMLAFFQFIRKYRQIYNLVPEAEMVSRDMSMWYYEKMAEGYIRGLEQGMRDGQVREIPPVFLARSLMGIAHIVGLRWFLWRSDDRAEVPPPLFKDLLELILYGLAPRAGSKSSLFC